MSEVKPIPDGYGTVTPYLVVKGAAEAIEFYKKALGAEEVLRMPAPDGSLMHAEIKIGDSIVMLGDEFPGAEGYGSPATLGGTSVNLFLYVEDADAAFQQAVDAGAKVLAPMADMFWGDRYGKLRDPFGHDWGIATHKEDVSPEEMGKRAEEFFAQMAQGN